MNQLVGTVCSKEIYTVDVNTSILDAGKLMTKKDIGALVITEKDEPVGIFTERDFLFAIANEGKNLNEYMGTPLHTINEGADLNKAIKKMVDYSIRRLPVVDDEKQIIGYLSMTDIIHSNYESIFES